MFRLWLARRTVTGSYRDTAMPPNSGMPYVARTFRSANHALQGVLTRQCPLHPIRLNGWCDARALTAWSPRIDSAIGYQRAPDVKHTSREHAAGRLISGPDEAISTARGLWLNTHGSNASIVGPTNREGGAMSDFTLTLWRSPSRGATHRHQRLGRACGIQMWRDQLERLTASTSSPTGSHPVYTLPESSGRELISVTRSAPGTVA
jgi:hypothetical protein